MNYKKKKKKKKKVIDDLLYSLYLQQEFQLNYALLEANLNEQQDLFQSIHNLEKEKKKKFGLVGLGFMAYQPL